MPAVGTERDFARRHGAEAGSRGQVIIRHFKLAAPMVDALNTPIAAALEPKKKVLFGLH